MSELSDWLDVAFYNAQASDPSASDGQLFIDIADALLNLSVVERARLVNIILVPSVPLARMAGRGKGQRYGQYHTPLLPVSDDWPTG